MQVTTVSTILQASVMPPCALPDFNAAYDDEASLRHLPPPSSSQPQPWREIPAMKTNIMASIALTVDIIFSQDRSGP